MNDLNVVTAVIPSTRGAVRDYIGYYAKNSIEDSVYDSIEDTVKDYFKTK